MDIEGSEVAALSASKKLLEDLKLFLLLQFITAAKC